MFTKGLYLIALFIEKLGTVQIPYSRMNKPIAVFVYNEILPRNKKEHGQISNI